MAYKRILTIQDVSCVGQCSLTVAMPILSACGHETCILPTAVLSTHTGGFGKPVVIHLSGIIREMVAHWKAAGIDFDAILVGYLGSLEAVNSVSQLTGDLLAPGGKLIVDPAMADHGKLYSGLNDEYASAMMDLCMKADVMIPNITEAAMMAGLPFCTAYDETYIQSLLNNLGGNNVILTGVSHAPHQTGAAVRCGGQISCYQHARLEKSYHGTGDMFAACFTGAWMQGKTLEEAVRLASDFTLESIRATQENSAHWYGVKFETQLPWLISRLFG